MNEAEYQELLEASWRRELTAAERARLRAGLVDKPELLAALDADLGLNRLLEKLPDAPVASNFTSLVLRQAELEMLAASRRRPFLADLWRRIARRPTIGFASVALVLCAGALALEQAHHQSLRRRNLELADFFKAAVPSDPALLQDFDAFDAIRRLPQPEDDELFAVLSK